ncbi:MAG: DUF2207 domain-containing protein [Ruminococcaceae bacterium]|nr:DUF2207 domain-containing protein [Oscillospiraceae bacterium]
MRRFWFFMILVLMLAVPVSAFSAVTSAESHTVAADDGSCRVTLTVQFSLDSVPGVLVYPLPAQARDITVDSDNVSGINAGTVRNVDLTKFIHSAGTHTLVIGYSLPNAVTSDKSDNLTFSLELLSGFELPVERLEFTVTLPGENQEQPQFFSTYYADSILQVMDLEVRGNQIVGSVHTRLQDHEKLVMDLPVTEELFPRATARRWSMDTLDLIMLCLGALAAAYWLLFLRGVPPKRVRRTYPVDGITAGEIHCRLTGQGADLTMMVITWAQLGYILIQSDDEGRVLLHKRMDMGNERDDFELKCFRKLFGKRAVVDGTAYHYAQLCQKVKRIVPGIREQFLPGNGSATVFRVLAAGLGTMAGISLAAAYAADTGWRVILSILLGAAGTAAAWLMQGTVRSLHSRHRRHLWTGLITVFLWVAVSQSAGEWNVALCISAAQILAGYGAFYGGRRSSAGKASMAQILGLRHYLKTVSPEELRRNLNIDPQYYYDLAPFALALGVDREFARQVKGIRLPQCPYLTTGMDGQMTAPEWNELLRDTVDALDAMQKRMYIDRFLGR